VGVAGAMRRERRFRALTELQLDLGVYGRLWKCAAGSSRAPQCTERLCSIAAYRIGSVLDST